MKELIELRGRFDCKVFNADGSFDREFSFDNGATTVGLNHMLATEFVAGGQATTWFGGLIDGTSTPTLAATDTMSSHAGWTENIQYTGGVRATWTPGTPSGGLTVNASPMNFTMTGNVTIAGAFLSTGSALSGTSGTLFSTGLGSTPQVLTISQILQITYTIQATPLN